MTKRKKPEVPKRPNKKKRSRWVGIDTKEERQATKEYQLSTLRVAVKATRKSTKVSREEGIKAIRDYYKPKEFISRKFIVKNIE